MATAPASNTRAATTSVATVTLATLVVCVLIAITVTYVFRWKGEFAPGFSHDPENWSQFGEYFGGVLGPILSSLTLVALIYTIWLQTKQIIIARDELAAARDDKRQTQEQAAISTFFEMVTLHHEIVNALQVPSGAAPPMTGRLALNYLYYSELLPMLNGSSSLQGATQPQRDGAVFDSFHDKWGRYIGHYFRNLYRIFKYINDSEIIVDKRALTGIIRAQLTEPELCLIFFNGISSTGLKFKPLMEGYALFDNLDPAAFPNPYSIDDFLPAAWGSNYQVPANVRKR